VGWKQPGSGKEECVWHASEGNLFEDHGLTDLAYLFIDRKLCGWEINLITQFVYLQEWQLYYQNHMLWSWQLDSCLVSWFLQHLQNLGNGQSFLFVLCERNSLTGQSCYMYGSAVQCCGACAWRVQWHSERWVRGTADVLGVSPHHPLAEIVPQRLKRAGKWTWRPERVVRGSGCGGDVADGDLLLWSHRSESCVL
jgi:hypothetical protein